MKGLCEALASQARLRGVRSGNVLSIGGLEARALGVVIRGLCVNTFEALDASGLTLERGGKGYIIGLASAVGVGAYEGRVTAASHCTVGWVAFSAAEEILGGVQEQKAVRTELARRLQRLRVRRALLRMPDCATRLACTIVDCVENGPEEDLCRGVTQRTALKVPRGELGHLCGIPRETVSRTLRVLEAKRWVVRTERGIEVCEGLWAGRRLLSGGLLGSAATSGG